MKKKVLAIILALGLAMGSFTVTGLAEEPMEPAVVAEEAAEAEDTDAGSEDEEEYAEPQAVPEDAAEEEAVSEDEEAAEAEDDESFVRPEIDRDALSLRNGEGNSVRTIVNVDPGTGEDGENGEETGIIAPGQLTALAERENTGFTTLAEAGAYLRDRMIARETETSLTVIMTDSEFTNKEQYPTWKAVSSAILEEAMAECEDPKGGDYLRYQHGQFSTRVSSDSFETPSYYNFTFTTGCYTTAEQEAWVTEKVRQIRAELNLSGQSELYKAAKIYDYITAHVTYDYDNLQNPSYQLQYTAYAALHDGTSVCQGYTNLFYRLCREEGLSVRIISGTGNDGAHAWNIVKIGDYYYNVDVTWDEGLAPSQYRYFLKSESDFEGHTRDSEYTGDFNQMYPMGQTSLSYPEEAKVTATALRMVVSETTVVKNEPVLIEAVVTPLETFNKVNFAFRNDTAGVNGAYSWSSLDPKAITITPTQAGSVVVEASVDGLSAQCKITVVNSVAELENPAVRLAGNSLSLDGDIGVNFYLEIPTNLKDNAVVNFLFNGDTFTYPVKDETAEKTENGADKYKFTVRTVAKEMADTITLTITDSSTGEKITLLNNNLQKDYTDGYQYSVEKYIELAKNEDGFDSELRTLMAAMENYGRFARKFFGHNTDNLHPDYTAINEVNADTVVSFKPVKSADDTLPEGLSYKGSNLTLLDKTTFSHFFVIDSNHSIDDYEFLLDGEVVTPTLTGDGCRITIADVPAAELGSPKVLTVSDGTSTYSISYSPMSYVWVVLNKERDYAYVCQALYNYYSAAVTYFANH